MNVKVPTWAGLAPALLVVSMLGCGGGGSSPAKTPMGDNPYQAEQVFILTRTFQDQMGTGSLVPSGGGHLTAEGYAFAEGEGLSLSNPLGGGRVTTYSMEFVFKFETVSGYRRVMDQSGLLKDTGLYLLQGQLDYFGLLSGATPMVPPAASAGTIPTIPAGAWAHVVITRDGATGHVVGYVNGTQVFDVDDSTDTVAVVDGSQAPLWFFKDDGSENSAGVVRTLRLYGKVLTANQVKVLAEGQLNP